MFLEASVSCRNCETALLPVSRLVDGYSLVGQGGYEFLSDGYVGRELSDRRLSCVVAAV